MLYAPVATRNHDVWICLLNRGTQGFERIGCPIGKCFFDRTCDQKRMAVRRAHCGNGAAYSSQSDGQTRALIPSIRIG